MAEDTTGWKVYRNEWYNDRIMETYINAPVIDKQNDLIPTEVLDESMDFYMKYGVYSYQHEELPIGLPLAYKIEDGKIVEKESDERKNLRETKQARQDRKDEYPEIGEQLDMLYHAIDADSDLKTKFSSFYNKIKSVKEKYPKPYYNHSSTVILSSR